MKGRRLLGKESEEVDLDATGWVEVRRRIRRRAVGRRDNDEDVKSRELVQIFVKMDGSRTVAMDVSQNDKVGDMMNRILNGVDMFVTSGGRVLRRCDKLRSCGAIDGSTVEVMSRMRGGGRHKDKKNIFEKKQAVSPSETRAEVGPST